MTAPYNEDQHLITEAVLRCLEERPGQLRDYTRVASGNVLRADPLVTGVVIHSEAGNDYSLAIQDVRTSPVTERVHQALTQPEHDALKRAAEALADAEDSGESFGDIYDPGRSSSGEEYVTSPDSAGFYTLVAGRPALVTVQYVTDPESIDEVLTELDEVYALAHPDSAGCDISGGTPSEM